MRNLFKAAKDDNALGLDPFVFPLRPKPLHSHLPMLSANVEVEAMDADEEDDSASCGISGVRCLWDTGAPITIISEDLLPTALRDHIRSDNYVYIYRLADDNPAVQVSMNVQLSNANFKFEILAAVRSSESLPNGFSGMIAGQKTFLDCLEYHVVPASILRSKNIDTQDYWGEIRILGRVADDEYEALLRWNGTTSVLDISRSAMYF